jgi:hypothetical protein
MGPGPHFMTGPVHVRGAAPGDVLQVDILEATPMQDWGFTAIMPFLGALPDEFTNYQHLFIDVDRNAGVCTVPWGLTMPLDPFFGVIGVAPPNAWGRIGSPQPRAHGGNMDNKELKPRHDALPASLSGRRTLFGRRRPRPAGRRRGLHRRGRDRAARPLPPDPPNLPDAAWARLGSALPREWPQSAYFRPSPDGPSVRCPQDLAAPADCDFGEI